MSTSVDSPAAAPANTLIQRLRNALIHLGLASSLTIGAYRLAIEVRIVSALNGVCRFREDRNRRVPLVELERIFCELAGRGWPALTIADRIEALIPGQKRVCTTSNFVVVVLRGGGDLLVIVREKRLLDKANELLGTALSCPSTLDTPTRRS